MLKCAYQKNTLIYHRQENYIVNNICKGTKIKSIKQQITNKNIIGVR